MNKNAVNTRVLAAIKRILNERKDVNKTSLAASLGVKPAKFSEILNGRMMAGTDIISQLCSQYGVDAEWILTGNYPVLSEGGNAVAAESPLLYSPDVMGGKPFYDVDFVGGFSEIFNSQTSVPACHIIVPGFDKAQLWCNVTGHSMEPKINHGDIIALRECTVSDVQFGEIYAVVLDTIRTIKILRKGSSPGQLRYVPINIANFDEQEFPITRILKIFEVLGSIKKFF